jgi:hypothetical protein
MQSQNCEEFLSHPRRLTRVGAAPVEKHGFLEAIEVCRAVGAMSKVVPDFPQDIFGELRIEPFFKLPGNLAATRHMFMAAVHVRCAVKGKGRWLPRLNPPQRSWKLYPVFDHEADFFIVVNLKGK